MAINERILDLIPANSLYLAALAVSNLPFLLTSSAIAETNRSQNQLVFAAILTHAETAAYICQGLKVNKEYIAYFKRINKPTDEELKKITDLVKEMGDQEYSSAMKMGKEKYCAKSFAQMKEMLNPKFPSPLLPD